MEQIKKQLQEIQSQLQELQSQKEEDNIKKVLTLALNKEQILLEKFSKNVCVYYGIVSNKNNTFIKIGWSGDLNESIESDKESFTSFILINVFIVENFFNVEYTIKEHPVLNPLIQTVIIKNTNYTEDLIEISTLSFEKIDFYINEIIKENDIYIDINDYHKMEKLLEDTKKEYLENKKSKTEFLQEMHDLEKEYLEIRKSYTELRKENKIKERLTLLKQ